MFERFTERARLVLVLAQEEARGLRHAYIGTEHILLGLLRVDRGLAARVLASLEITVERARPEVVRIVGLGQEVPPGQIPFTPRARKVFERAVGEALSFGHSDVDTEHILLGIVREDEGKGVAARILRDFGADPERIGSELVLILAEPGGPRPAFAEDESDADIGMHPGWRGRPILLAALGAAVLARSAFAPTRTGMLEPLEMQLLMHLVVEPRRRRRPSWGRVPTRLPLPWPATVAFSRTLFVPWNISASSSSPPTRSASRSRPRVSRESRFG